MKKLILLGSLALATSAMADATIRITGATAFRTAAIKALCSSFTGTIQGGYYDASSGNYSMTGAAKSVLKGTFPGIAGTTTILCAWNGSVEGVKALHDNEDVAFLNTVPTATVNADGTGGSLLASSTTNGKADLAFSDVFQSSTPYTTNTLYGGPNGSPVGVVAFTFVKSEGSESALTNITGQNARALFSAGFKPLSLFTGVAADASKTVYLTGRNDGSGTRTTFLAETAYGISVPVHQFKPTLSGSSGSNYVITTLQEWPTGDGTNVSNIWNPDTAGNGGFSSGSGLVNSMMATDGSVTVKDATGATIATGQDVSLVGYQSVKDAADAVVPAGSGGQVLSYNGQSIAFDGAPGSGGAKTLTAASLEKVRRGGYTLWGYEHLFSKTEISDPAVNAVDTVWLAIAAGCTSTNLSTSGIQLDTMMVSRSTDGATVQP